MIPCNSISSFFGDFTRRPFFHSPVISFFFRILLSTLCRASISIPSPAWTAAVSSQKVLSQEENEIETDSLRGGRKTGREVEGERGRKTRGTGNWDGGRLLRRLETDFTESTGDENALDMLVSICP